MESDDAEKPARKPPAEGAPPPGEDPRRAADHWYLNRLLGRLKDVEEAFEEKVQAINGELIHKLQEKLGREKGPDPGAGGKGSAGLERGKETAAGMAEEKKEQRGKEPVIEPDVSARPEPPPDYCVELDVYHGPLDLLLYLIKRDELDVYDIPIAKITDSYLAYVRMLREVCRDEGLDINLAGDFLVMAATLMEIKSAMLLPRPPAAEGPDGRTAAQELTDPRYELVQKLLEYKRFKDAASALERRQHEHQERFPRRPGKREADGIADEPPPVDLDEVQVWDLLAAFTRLMKEVGVRKPRDHEVTYDDTPIDLHAADIEDRLRREHTLSFRSLIEGRRSRSEMIGVFLALLELIRQKKILVRQGEAPNEIEIARAPAEHREPPAAEGTAGGPLASGAAREAAAV